MVDPRIIDKLDSLVVSERKEAIKTLAKMKDREALVYLADVVRNDRDPEVRELARKAGVYIKKNTMEMPATSLTDDRPGKSAGAATVAAQSLYVEEEDEPVEELPLPSEIQVSQSDIDRAQGYVDQAMSMSVRGNNQRGAELLARALKTNPRLMYDDYAKSLAANITGLPADEAMKRLMPSPDSLHKRGTRQRSRSTASVSSPVQTMFAVLTIVAAVVALVGYMAFPWVDIWGYSDPEISAELALTTGQDPAAFQDATLRDSVEMSFDMAMESGLQQQLGSELGVQDPAQVDRISQIGLDYVLGLNLSPSGMDTTNYALGFQNVLEVLGVFSGLEPLLKEVASEMGVTNIDTGELDNVSSEFENLADEMGMQITLSPEPLDFTYILVPIVAMAGLALAFLSMMQPSITKWSIVMILGVLGMIPIGYFYASGFESLVQGSFDLAISMAVAAFGLASATGIGADQLGQLNELSGATGFDINALLSGADTADLAAQVPKDDLLGLGYFITAIAMVAMLILPLLAMLFIPEAKEEAAA